MNKSFENLNVVALYDVLAEILSEKHGAKITYTVKEAGSEKWPKSAG